MESGNEILLASQFTLMAKTQNGTKPDFRHAKTANDAKIVFEKVLVELKTSYDPLKIQCKFCLLIFSWQVSKLWDNKHL